MRRMTLVVAALVVAASACGCSGDEHLVAAQTARDTVDERIGGRNIWNVGHIGESSETGLVSMECSDHTRPGYENGTAPDVTCEMYDVPYELDFDDDGDVIDFKLNPEKGGGF